VENDQQTVIYATLADWSILNIYVLSTYVLLVMSREADVENVN
jgi:hypothetical protein